MDTPFFSIHLDGSSMWKVYTIDSSKSICFCLGRLFVRLGLQLHYVHC